jgi:hypothetical protein
VARWVSARLSMCVAALAYPTLPPLPPPPLPHGHVLFGGGSAHTPTYTSQVVRRSPVLRDAGPAEAGCGLATHAGLHTLRLAYHRAGWVGAAPELLLRCAVLMGRSGVARERERRCEFERGSARGVRPPVPLVCLFFCETPLLSWVSCEQFCLAPLSREHWVL